MDDAAPRAEVLAPFIVHPITRRFLDHPQRDRFDAAEFRAALEDVGFELAAQSEMWSSFAWFVARKSNAV